MSELKQRKLFTRREFIIMNDGLRVLTKNLSNSQEIEIPFEEINSKKVVRQSKTDVTLIVLTLIFSLIFFINAGIKIFDTSDISWVALLINFIIAAFLAGVTYMTSRKFILIYTTGSGYIEMFADKPSISATNEFLAALDLKINDFLKSRYGTIDKDLPSEPQLSNLVWLKERGILDEIEFEKLKNLLLGKSNSDNRIGFASSK